MTNPDNSHFPIGVIYLIADAPIADSDTPYSLFTSDFEASRWARIIA
jgi:hypothetical protein